MSWVQFEERVQVSLYSTVSRPILGPAQPPDHGLLGVKLWRPEPKSTQPVGADYGKE